MPLTLWHVPLFVAGATEFKRHLPLFMDDAAAFTRQMPLFMYDANEFKQHILLEYLKGPSPLATVLLTNSFP